MSPFRAARRAFTLVELLVVIAIIGTLVAILIPGLSSARAAANASSSKSNMSGFGKGFVMYAADHDGRLCSGAFDHFRDGDIRQNGWVADLLALKASIPGKAIDPAHRSKLCETVGDYTGATVANQGNLASGVTDGRWPAGTLVANVTGAAHFGGAPQARELWSAGHNTNYVTTWHFSRGDPSAADGYSPGTRALSDGDGPLSENMANQSATQPQRIALMAPARAVAGANGLIDAATATALKNFAGTTIAQANERYTKSFTDGMIVPFTDVNMGGGAGQFVHDMSGILPLHQPKTSDGKGGNALVLCADGHVETVADTASLGSTTAGDGFIGNGPDGNNSNLGLDQGMYSEVESKIWVKRLRVPQ